MRPVIENLEGERVVTIYLHIGLPKTGTTAIQNFCAQHRDTLAKHGYFYPKCLGSMTHTGAAMYAAGFESRFPTQRNPKITSLELYEEFCTKLDDQFSKEFKNSKCKDIIISSEQLYVSIKSIDAIEKLKNWLSRFGDFKVLIWLRRQDDLALSAFGETIRMGSTNDFGEFISSPRGRHLLDFDQGVSRWAKVFGPDSIVLRVFESVRMVNKNPIQDFLHVLGLDAVSESFPAAVSTVTRESLSAEAIAFLTMFNKELFAAERGNKGLRPLIRSAKRRESIALALQSLGPGSKPDLSRETRKEIIDLYKESNKKLFNRHGVPDFDYKIKSSISKDHVYLDAATASRYAAVLWLNIFDELSGGSIENTVNSG